MIERTDHDLTGPQEDEVPNLRLAVLVTVALLEDLDHHLDPEQGRTDEVALRLRCLALLAVMHRLERLLDEEENDDR